MTLNALRRLWRQLQGHSCYTCQFSETFRSNGDGQVSRLHTFCRYAQSPYYNRPIPHPPWCDLWQQADDPHKRRPPELDQTGLSM
ncbi:MAG: hypothetical protein GXP38_17460 [Chloroflexi bacterium]|nr:hypothetical protein [Chloroflexota bacterium]